MADTLAKRVFRLRDDFFAAVRQGPAATAAFNSDYSSLLEELETAFRAGTLTDVVREVARSSVESIFEHARLVQSFDARSLEITHSASDESDDTPDSPADTTIPSSSASSQPLLRFFLSNICFPYPGTDEKERIAEEVRALGWRDFDKKKVEDWLNRKRNQSGFVAILRRYCGDDREVMRQLCRTALFGSAAEQARLPDGAVEDVEGMRDYVQSQLDELSEEGDAAWVDRLAVEVRAVLGAESGTGLVQHEPSDDGDDYDTDSDTSSDLSATDVDDDDDDDDDEPCTIIGAKRKLISVDLSPLPDSRPLSRSLSIASSSSSSSTACSLRSFSAFSMSSASSGEQEDADDICDRPAKRIRSESFGPDSHSSLDSPDSSSPTIARFASPLFTTYQTKRKHLDGNLCSRTSAMKRSRYAALGVTSRASDITVAHLASLSELCTFDWTPVEAAVRDLDANSYTVDCTQPNHEASDDEDFAIFDNEDEVADETSTWSRLQIDAILRMLLSASVQPLAVSLSQSAVYAYAFDVDTLGTHAAIDLEAMMKLTPEALSAMFDAMNRFTPAPIPAGGTVVPTAETMSPAEETMITAHGTAVTSSEDALHSLEIPFPTRDILVPAIDIAAPSLDVAAPAIDALSPVLDSPGPALDVFVSAMGTPALGVDTLASAPEAPASETEEPLSSPEQSPSPTSPSSSDSEGDSPPALSDDSGSSSRSSSVESDSEQDSLLMSPEALSADYSQLNDELLYGKAPNVDPSQLQVEFGAVPQVTTADESSCASELLERYLNDQRIWA